MDPLFLSLAVAVATGIATVAGKLIEQGVVEPALEPATTKLKQLVQAGVKGVEQNDALTGAILAAIEDASGQEGESLAAQYARRLRLHVLVEPDNAALRDQVMRLVYLASSADPSLIPASLVHALGWSDDQRQGIARFLFALRRRLNRLPEFQPLLQAAHQQAVETALKEMALDLSALAGTVTPTHEGAAVRVRIVKDEWNAAPYLTYLANTCNILPLRVIDPKYGAPTSERTVTLSDIYINLEVTTRVPVKPDERKRAPRP